MAQESFSLTLRPLINTIFVTDQGGGRSSVHRSGPVPFPGPTGRKAFLFLFNHGDEWRSGVTLVCTGDAVAPDVTYLRVAASAGATPPAPGR